MIGRNLFSTASLKILPRETWLLLVFAGLLCFFAGHHARKAEAETEKPKQRVEYRIVNFNYDEYKNTPEWKAAVASQNGNATLARGRFLQQVLNLVAKSGWRLVNVEQVNKQFTILYFERPV